MAHPKHSEMELGPERLHAPDERCHLYPYNAHTVFLCAGHPLHGAILAFWNTNAIGNAASPCFITFTVLRHCTPDELTWVQDGVAQQDPSRKAGWDGLCDCEGHAVQCKVPQ